MTGVARSREVARVAGVREVARVAGCRKGRLIVRWGSGGWGGRHWCNGRLKNWEGSMKVEGVDGRARG